GARGRAATARPSPPARSPTARGPRAVRAALPGSSAARTPARGSSSVQLEAARPVAHFPAELRDLVAQAICLGELARRARRSASLCKLHHLGGRLLLLGEGGEAEDSEGAPQEVVIAPGVQARERLRRVEVVVERGLERGPVAEGLVRRAEDVAK